MASLSQRLRALQILTSGTTESLDHLRLGDLAAETISFGQKHQGHTYLEAWEDQEWVQFMVSRYQGSTKDSHRRFLKFVELKIEMLEQQQTVIPRTTQQIGQDRPQARPKPVPKHRAMPISLQDGDDDWDVEFEMFVPLTTAYAPSQMTAGMNALQARVLNMENALTRVIRHIEDQAMLNKDHQGTEDA